MPHSDQSKTKQRPELKIGPFAGGNLDRWLAEQSFVGHRR